MSRLQTTMENRLRRRVQIYMNETCTIARVDQVQGRLGMEDTPVIVSTDVLCRVIDDSRSIGQGYQQTGESQMQIDAYRVVLPAGQMVDAGYQITVGSRVYDVIELLDDRSNELFIECRVRRVRS